MAELADAPDLGSGGRPCRFKSCHPHFISFIKTRGLFFYEQKSFLQNNFIPTGLIKNFTDIICVSFTCIVSLVFAHKIVGIGIGTLFAMVFVGRTIAVFNHSTKKPLDKLAGINV